MCTLERLLDIKLTRLRDHMHSITENQHVAIVKRLNGLRRGHLLHEAGKECVSDLIKQNLSILVDQQTASECVVSLLLLLKSIRVWSMLTPSVRVMLTGSLPRTLPQLYVQRVQAKNGLDRLIRTG